MRVSAIIPTKNMANFLNRSVGSLLAQTRPVDEIIIADDNSTDHTSVWLGTHMLDPTNEPLAKVLRAVKNGGPSWGICGGRNAAFSAATGDLILPLDADDWVEPTYLEKTLAKMTDGVGIVSTHMRYFGEREGTIIYANQRTYEAQLQYNNITVCSLVRAEALKQAGPWDDNLRGWEDWDMWLRILKLGWKHAFVPEVLFNYRLHSTGMNQWANENRATLIKYLTAKHPGFLKIRETGAVSDNGEFRKEWNGL